MKVVYKLVLLLCSLAILSVFAGCASDKVRVGDATLSTQEAAERIERLGESDNQQRDVIRQLKPEAFEDVGLYRIKSGDTWNTIAAAHGLTLAELEALNPGVNCCKLFVYQVIRVKPMGE